MIVNYTEKGWQIISQRAHGLLAGQLCFNLHHQFQTAYWVDTIVATIEHDDAFSEFEMGETLLNDSGGPVNFKMRDFEMDKCERLLRMALTKSRYIALLTSSHIQFLYGNSGHAAVRNYCAKLKKHDRIWLKGIPLTRQDISDAYTILQWCDACSLLLCQKMIQPENRKIEISNGPGNRSYFLRAGADAILHIEPWPFETDRFEIDFESRTLADLVFKSESDFRTRLINTNPEITTCIFAKN